MTYRLGVDVGGTFTDFLLVEEASGATWRAKQVKSYVETLATQLRDGGVTGELTILRSDGGLSSADAAVDSPVTMLLSGPA